MKKITLVVPDSLVGPLVSLVADQAAFLLVETQEEKVAAGIDNTAKDIKPPHRNHPRPIGRVSTKKLLMDLLNQGPATMEQIQKTLINGGYASNTCYGAVQRMQSNGMVELVGNKFRFKEVL